MSPATRIALSCAAALSVKSVFETYAGDYREQKVPTTTGTGTGGTGKSRMPSGMGVERIPSFDVMRDLYEKGEAGEGIRVAWTTMREARERLQNHQTHTLGTCKASALNYEMRSAWRKGDLSAYNAAYRNGWVDECCRHMAAQRRWDFEACRASAVNYKTRMAWEHGEVGAYNSARHNGWMDECCSHMAGNKKWTIEACKASALRYDKRTTWYKGEPKAYDAAQRNGWLDECCGHMNAKASV